MGEAGTLRSLFTSLSHESELLPSSKGAKRETSWSSGEGFCIESGLR